MELQIPQTFKVQWLNTTLKFIKDDTQLVKDYPQMPYSHVEYLHNLIWQRKNDVGLGFKSLYSPVWEAMKIYSVKYQFKIVVKKSEDGMSGHLIMEKIPKVDQSIKKHNEEKDKNNNEENKERDNETIQNSEDAKKLQTEVVKCKRPASKSKKKSKTKKAVPQMTKDQKVFIENQDILDSLSPLLIKKMLKLILDFLSDELTASKIFSNLAPIESRFLENFLSIHQRKNDLEVLLSPACNEILTEISKCLDDFSKTCCLEISCVGVNSTTNKREVKYTKVPVFPNKNMAERKIEENSIRSKSDVLNNGTNRKLNIPSNSNEEYNMTVEKNLSNEIEKNEFKKQTKTLQINVIGEERFVNLQPTDKAIDNKFIEALSASVKKPNNVKPKTNTILKDTSLNKSFLLPKTSMSMTNERITSAADTPSMKVEQKSLKKKVLQNITVPINTDSTLSQNSQVIIKSQTEAVKCIPPEPSLKKEKHNKPIPEMSRGLKMFMENQNIIDSLSPWFLKTMLKSILDFLSDDLSASKIFSNLVPIESKFLENFLSIYERKNDLEVLLSPACNEILTEISKCFADFSKTCCLEISCVGINSSTDRREIKYTKVPVFPSKKKAKQKLKEKLIQTKTATIPSNDNTTQLLNMPSNVTMEKNASKKTKNSKSKNNTNEVSESTHKVKQAIDNNVVEALSTFIKKPNDEKPKTTTYLKDTSLNKNVPLPKSISFTKEGTSNTADTPNSKVEQKKPKMKILQDMTIPLNIDKAARMMQLMGWKGGALGLRGDGITEPIIPTPNFNNCGLGHVKVKKEANKETKNQIRTEFINKILKMIDNDIKVSVINLQNKLKNRETRFLKITIKLINDRMNLDAEFEKRLEIKDKMLNNMDIIFNIDIEDENRKIIITKTSKTGIKVNQNTPKDINAEDIDTNAIQNTNSEVTFKTIVLKSILELIKSQSENKVIRFNNELKDRHIQCSNTMILLINERQNVQQKNSQVVAEWGSKVLEAIGDIKLSVKINESERKLIITKTSKTGIKINQYTPKDIDTNAIQNSNSEASFKTIVLKSILELIKSDDIEKVIRFNKDVKTRHIQYSHIIILLINERQYVKHKNCRVVAELGSKILEAIGDINLSVKINEIERYIVIRKKHRKSNDNQKIIKKVVNHAESEENNENAFDNVRNYLRIKKKNKLLNALYRYEMEDTEEFKENQWYNTLDKSLIESKQLVIQITKKNRIII